MAKKILNYEEDEGLLFAIFILHIFSSKAKHQLINKIMLVNLTLKNYLKVVSKIVVKFTVDGSLILPT